MTDKEKPRHIMSASPVPYSKMTDEQKLALLAPHALVMAVALEKMAMSLGRFAPAGTTLRAHIARILAMPNLGDAQRWDAEAAQAVIDALDAIGSGAVL